VTFVFSWSIEACAFWLITAAWLAEAVLMRSRARGRRTRAPGVTGLTLAILGALGLALAGHKLGWGQLEGAAALGFRRGALLVYASGVGLRWWAARELAALQAFTRDVRVDVDMPLARTGPYRVWAHPLYTGLWLAAVGLTGLCANLPGLLLGTVLSGVVIGRRLRAEERALETVLGARYAHWRRARWLLLPHVW
jgi:protein-S-isoprenylcysteine O-methyltransferase Ste14